MTIMPFIPPEGKYDPEESYSWCHMANKSKVTPDPDYENDLLGVIERN